MRAHTQLKKAAACTVFLFLFCEFFIYYIVLYECSWPDLEPMKAKEPLKAMMLADTHLLGSKDGHWFDKLRREWQMERAFQAALTFFKPDVVFILGDLFDEGLKCDEQEWQYYLSRFHKMFRHADGTLFHVVFGNHDIGFHYEAKENPHLYERFSAAFHLSSVELLDIKGNLFTCDLCEVCTVPTKLYESGLVTTVKIRSLEVKRFVLVNSIALQGDDCSMCSEAVTQLKSVAAKLSCHRRKARERPPFFWEKHLRDGKREQNRDVECEVAEDAPAPVLIQHFPLYRPSEVNCSGVDAPPADERAIENTERKDVVSREATRQLLHWLRPRLVLSGHTHHSCFVVHSDGTPELTIPSFSWRNRNNPSFVLALITPRNFSVSKCFLPQESTVILIYLLALVLLVVSNAGLIVSYCRLKRKCRRFCDR